MLTHRLILPLALLLSGSIAPVRATAEAECPPLAGDSIRAADIAAAVPAFQTLDAGLKLAIAPAPGIRRVFGVAELRRLAARHGIPAESVTSGACFEHRLAPLSPRQVMEVLERVPELAGANIALVEHSRHAVPEGDLEFPRSALSVPQLAGPETVLLWRGRVKYANGRSVPIWVRFRASVNRPQLVAAETLAAGKPVGEEQLLVKEMAVSPFSPAALAMVSEAAGRAPVHHIPAGRPLFARMLEPPKAVQAGAPVEVEVVSGAARLLLTAVAESAGRAGDKVMVRNPNGKRFQATVQAPGKVIVHAGPQSLTQHRE